MPHVRMQVKFLCNVSFKEGWEKSTGSSEAMKNTGCTNSQKTEEAAGEVLRVADSLGLPALEAAHAFAALKRVHSLT